MNQRFSGAELFKIRNEISIRRVVEEMLEIPSKEVEGVFRFLCPTCSEFQTAINPKTNLGRCFRCAKNFNPIDIVMATQKVRFIDSVKLLLNYQGSHPG